ncbi:uncharacterized protein LOC127861822 [Dreissena polymorpha]|uniref:uncharacterized protein LOC127861822 n=1 Tax=Dreissena polymorpha TaxID=45954 RepID=UPI0022648BAC|nr:uncharacterized protein LOC127861822 [Dreissena polymorpha]
MVNLTMTDSPPFDLQAYQPPISLWQLVQQYTPQHEREEIKNMMGESLIDQSIELHEEIDTLLEIWRDYRAETTNVKPVSKLAEPRGMRDRLIQEIQFFVGSVKEKAKSEGVNADKLLSRHNTEVLDYALDTYRPESVRPSSRQAALGLDGRETPMICSPTCSDRTSEASILSEEVEAMNEKLNILKLDEVLNHLRSTLEEEVETLLKDIRFLQNCLDDEATFRAESVGTITREPTLSGKVYTARSLTLCSSMVFPWTRISSTTISTPSIAPKCFSIFLWNTSLEHRAPIGILRYRYRPYDLRDERSQLERELLSSMKSQMSPELKKPAFSSPNVKGNLAVSRKSSGQLKPQAPSTGKLAPVKAGPMKAFNSLESQARVASPPNGPIKQQNSGMGSDSLTRTPESFKDIPIRTHAAATPKMPPSLKSETTHNSEHSHAVNNNKHVENNTGYREHGAQHVSSRPGSDSSSRRHGDFMRSDGRHGLKSMTQPTLEAVVTLKKGHGGDGTDIHMIPSPPPSSKPDTPPRPSSAQRFRLVEGGSVDTIMTTTAEQELNDDPAKPLIIVEQTVPAADEPLPLWRKLCFAVGGAPYQTTNTVINFFISIFLLEVAELEPYYVSIILFTGKAWDAVTDPTCGFLVHRTDTRFGKFRPWILFSAPFSCGAYFCLWYVPNFSVEGKFAWYFCFYCSFQMFLSGLHVPYTSMTMTVTSSQKDRDSVTAYRMVLEAVGVLVAVLVQGQLVAKYRKTGDCGEAGEITEQMLKDEKWSYVLGAIIVVSAYLLCACTVFFGSKEKPGFTTAETSGFFSGARQVITFKPYMLLCASFMFQSLAIAIVQGNLALYCTHAVDMSDQFSTIILVLLVTAILAMPLWQICVGKFGKKSTFAAGMILLIPALISLMYIPKGDKYVMYPVVVIAGVAVSVALLLPWSMLPDVIDEFYLQHGTRKESIFYSFYVFFNKLSMGVGLGISQAVLGIGGYKTGECVQPSSVGLALKMLMVPGPVVMTLVALVALWFYPIDESRRRHIKDEIKRRIESRSSTLIKPQSNTHQEYASVSYRSITESSGV